jgi:Fuc2NAc and GlcNAc transferase
LSPTWWLAGLVAIPLLAFGLALTGTPLVRRYALGRNVLDIPNPRSSHAQPTPRGGGAAVMPLVVAGLAGAAIVDARPPLWALAGGVAAMAGVGWVDDHRGLSPTLRLLLQVVVAAAVVAFLGPLAAIELGGRELALGWVGWPVTLLWFVWMTNLYNFMDGIDGIAGVEAAAAGGVMALWFAAFGAPHLALACAVLAGAALGFLVWNWAPARIFLGDVGSLGLGFCFAGLAVVGVNEYDMPWAAFILLLAVFIGDATITIIARLTRGERLTEAHKSHFYQRAVQTGLSHAQVSCAVVGANLLFAVLATLAVTRVEPSWAWPALGIVVLTVLAALVTRRQYAASSQGAADGE